MLFYSFINLIDHFAAFDSKFNLVFLNKFFKGLKKFRDNYTGFYTSEHSFIVRIHFFF